LVLAGSVPHGESLLLLLSGGGSAITAVPAEGVTLDDKRRTTDRLLKAGADISALNTVRKHISALKGGWLAAAASVPLLTLAISDVVGDDLSVIASGPAVSDASTFADAVAVLRRFGGLDVYPQPVVARLLGGVRGDLPETPKPGDPRLALATARVIGGRRDAMEGAVREAQSRGYFTLCLDEPVVGDARAVSVSHVEAVLAHASAMRRPACIISSGETTVRVTGDGKGGRNQEFALACAAPLASIGVQAVMASVGTDGIDGPTDAAGAIVDNSTNERARGARLSAEASLQRNDAYRFFAPLNDLVITGPTGTNVGDLQIILLS